MKSRRMASLRRSLGRRGENAVIRLLRSKDCRILAHNWKIKAGELDIVALDGDEIVFVEVKTKRHKKVPSGLPQYSNLSNRQRRRNLAAAKFFRKAMQCGQLAARFDLWQLEYSRTGLLYSCTCTTDYLMPLPPENRPL